MCAKARPTTLVPQPRIIRWSQMHWFHRQMSIEPRVTAPNQKGTSPTICYMCPLVPNASEDRPDTFLINLSVCTPCTCAASPSIVSDAATPIASNHQKIDQHSLRQTIRDFLMSLHQSVTILTYSCSWVPNPNRSCTLLIKGVRDFNDEILSKISAWDMLKKRFGTFEDFLEACGFDVWQIKKGSRLHTYVSRTRFRSDLCVLAFVEGSTCRLSRDV